MHGNPQTRDQARAAERYFTGLVDDYRQAYHGRSRGIRQRALNRLFRYRAFRQRTEAVNGLLERYGVAGKRVLDLGCGTGEMSRAAARLGARVTGLDIVEGMIQVARTETAAAGLGDRADFRVHDITLPYEETADVTLLIGVVEYYRDLEAILARAASATGELLIIQDTQGPWFRRTLRHTLAWAEGFYVRYRDPGEIATAMARWGFVETDRIRGSSFTVMSFRPGRS
jgi:SAM-dependent methyltransferase